MMLPHCHLATRLVPCLATILGLGTTPLGGQSPGDLPTGSRVRVSVSATATQVRIGRLLSVSADTLRLATTTGEAPIPFRSITNLELSRGRHGHAGRGGLIGLAVGLGAGLTAGLIAHRESQFIEVNTAGVGLITAIGGGVGAALGALIGSAFKSERWEDVPLTTIGGQAGHPILLTGLAVRLSAPHR